MGSLYSNSDHILLNTPTRLPNTTLRKTSSPDITTVSNTLYNWTTQHALPSDHLHINTVDVRHGCKDWTQFTEDTESSFAQTTIHTAHGIFAGMMLIADGHSIPNGKIHSNFRLLPDRMVCRVTLNPDKTTCTLFTPDPAEYKSNLDLKINNITFVNMYKNTFYYKWELNIKVIQAP